MNIPQLAADIAARIPAMAKDSSINNANLIAQLIFHECAGCDEIDKECAKWRGRCAELEAANQQLREEIEAMRYSVAHGRGGMISPMCR